MQKAPESEVSVWFFRKYKKIKEFEFRKCFLFPFMRENLLILPWDSMSRSFSSSSTFLFIEIFNYEWLDCSRSNLSLSSLYLIWSFLFIYLSCDSHAFSFWDFSFYSYCTVSTFGVFKSATDRMTKKSKSHLDPQRSGRFEFRKIQTHILKMRIRILRITIRADRDMYLNALAGYQIQINFNYILT